MANRIVKAELEHFDVGSGYDTNSSFDRAEFADPPIRTQIGPRRVLVDKGLSISELSDDELLQMNQRLERELMVQEKIRALRRNAGELGQFESATPIDTLTPINQLYHHGIRGMKWGIRRFQNPDGSLTAAGRRRYGDDDDIPDDSNGRPRLFEGSKDNRMKEAKLRRGVKNLSNAELREINNRLKLEEEYQRLVNATSTKKGESMVKKALRNAGEQALSELSKGVMVGLGKKIISDLAPEIAKAGGMGGGNKDKKG